MSGFSIEWLNLREISDHRARDKNLLKKTVDWLDNLKAKDRVIVDLGSGTGSTIRSLQKFTTRLPLIQWRLVDNDPELLAEAIDRHSEEYSIESFLVDLSETQKLPLDSVSLITASALLDLVSENFIQELCQLVKGKNDYRPVGLYSALNYDGCIKWTPSHPLDAAILVNFNTDQRRDKGFGPALGPDATDFLKCQFHATKFQCLSANSPWLLDSADYLLTESLINGISEVALQTDGLTNSDVLSWKSFRIKNIRTGTCFLGHTDILVLPQSFTSGK
jgi:SAM-dependent methyltransferase